MPLVRCFLAASVLLLALSATPSSDAAAALAPAKCAAAYKPTGLKFSRAVGQATGRLSWRAPKRKNRAASYRVIRNGKIVGQTRARSLRIRISPGRSYRFQVKLMRGRKLTRCVAVLAHSEGFAAPSAPRAPALSNVSERSVTLSWAAARRGDGQLAGYRVMRNGSVVKQVKRTRTEIPLTSNSVYKLSVLAVDTRGNLSPSSPEVTVDTAHKAPSAPTGLTAAVVSDTSAGISWQPSQASGGRIVGYRVWRDNVLLGQVESTSYVASNLAHSRRYSFSVAAIDSYGFMSPVVGPASVTTRAPEASTGSAHAFLLASTDQSFRDFQAHYRNIGVVYPTYFECNRTTSVLQGKDDPLVTSWAQARRVKVLARIDCQHGPTLHKILTEAGPRSATLNGIMERVRTHGYEGVNIDFESGYASDRAAYTSFIAELASRLHAEGKQLSIAVSPKSRDDLSHPRSGIFDYPALAQHADHIFVMNWGIHWAWSAPGAISEYPWATGIANYVAQQPNPKRWILGIPMYGFDWPANGGRENPGTPIEYTTIRKLIASTGATPRYDETMREMTFSYQGADGKTHTVWYLDSRAIGERMQLARDRNLGGVGFWRLGEEDQTTWQHPLLAPSVVW